MGGNFAFMPHRLNSKVRVCGTVLTVMQSTHAVAEAELSMSLSRNAEKRWDEGIVVWKVCSPLVHPSRWMFLLRGWVNRYMFSELVSSQSATLWATCQHPSPLRFAIRSLHSLPCALYAYIFSFHSTPNIHPITSRDPFSFYFSILYIPATFLKQQ